MANDVNEEVVRILRARDDADEEKAFNDWRNDLLSQPSDLELQPKNNFKVDIELQPLRWLQLGIELVESSKVTGHVELAGGIEGAASGSYLAYPIFQMATEIFLKGMWLCQFDECRVLMHSSYIDQPTRTKRLGGLGPKGLGHDLIKIVNEVRKIPEYAKEAASLEFLDLIERILRRYYFPPYRADRRTRWADARYPKRVYDDHARKSQAESFTSYPCANWIVRLFRKMELDVDRIWSLRASLSDSPCR
jgi:hypothetical protein